MSRPGPRILHVKQATDLTHESRLLRELHAAHRHGVFAGGDVAGRWEIGWSYQEEIEQIGTFYRLPMLRGARFRWWQGVRQWDMSRRISRLAKELSPSVIECHAIETLEWCIRLKRELNVPVVYAPHELESDKNGLTAEGQAKARAVERRYIRDCAAIICVNDSIADWYAEAYGVQRPAVVRNIPSAPPPVLAGHTPGYRERFGIPQDALIFVYQGGLFSGRQIEQFIRVFETARPDRHLVMMGYGSLEPAVTAAAARCPNIHFHPAVAPGEVLEFTRSADVGLVGMENVCLSYSYSLPNKMFEYLLAGVPIAANDLVEIRRVVMTHQVGWICGATDKDWSSFVNSVTSEQIALAKAATLKARDHFSWETEERVLISEYQKVLDQPRARN